MLYSGKEKALRFDIENVIGMAGLVVFEDLHQHFLRVAFYK